jgi:hypothetical protein
VVLEEVILLGQERAEEFRIGALESKGNVKRFEIVGRGGKAAEASNQGGRSFQVFGSAVHAHSVGGNGGTSVVAFEFASAKIHLRSSVFGRKITFGENIRLVVVSFDVQAELLLEGPGAGEARVNVEPEAHRNEVLLGNRTRFAIEPEVVVDKKFPDAEFDAMERASGAKAKRTEEVAILGSNAEARVQGGFVGRKLVIVQRHVIAIGC